MCIGVMALFLKFLWDTNGAALLESMVSQSQ